MRFTHTMYARSRAARCLRFETLEQRLVLAAPAPVNEVDTTSDVAEAPIAVAPASVLANAPVANDDTYTLSEDTPLTTGEVERSLVEVQLAAKAIAVDQAGSTIWSVVGDSGDDFAFSLVRIDRYSGEIADSFAIGGDPNDLSVTRDDMSMSFTTRDGPSNASLWQLNNSTLISMLPRATTSAWQVSRRLPAVRIGLSLIGRKQAVVRV